MKKDPLLGTLQSIAQNMYDAACYFNRTKTHSAADVDAFYQQMKEFERKGDSLIHHLILTLNKVFITELERDDMLNLAVKLDDVLDGMEACAARFYMYDIIEGDEVMNGLSDLIEKNAEQIFNAMFRLCEGQLKQIHDYSMKIDELESEADELLRRGIRDLMQKSDDAIYIMKYKEVYEILESVSDSCEDVKDMMETIVMRHT